MYRNRDYEEVHYTDFNLTGSTQTEDPTLPTLMTTTDRIDVPARTSINSKDSCTVESRQSDPPKGVLFVGSLPFTFDGKELRVRIEIVT